MYFINANEFCHYCLAPYLLACCICIAGLLVIMRIEHNDLLYAGQGTEFEAMLFVWQMYLLVILYYLVVISHSYEKDV